MNRDSFQRISRIRVKEAKKLLDEGYYCGAYYLIGYSVECALKACISRQIRKYDFPDKKLINDSHTHDVRKLIDIAGLSYELETDIKNNRDFGLNWNIVKEWSEAVRYDDSITEIRARDLYTACTNRQNGILNWIRSRW